MSLEAAVAACEVRHTRFLEILDLISNRIEETLRGGSPTITSVVGPSRIGKTQLSQAIAGKFPRITVGGIRQVPVVVANSPTSTTIPLLPMAVLNALGVPYRKANATAGKLSEHMYAQLAMAGSKAVVYDEASQLVDRGTRVLPFAASEWIKETLNKSGVSQVLIGVFKLRRLFEANDQLRLRAYKEIVWRPYDASVQSERESYQMTLDTFLNVFHRSGWTIAMPLPVIASNCYLHAPGLVGALSDLLKELARQLRRRQPGDITFQDFKAAASVLESAGHPNHPAFAKLEVSTVEMHQAYMHALGNGEPSACL